MRKSLAAFAFISTLSITGQAYADQYGCEVLMCLSNPKGPMAERECEPPIKKFLDGQAKHPKDPFPSCPEGAPATMQPAYRPYDPCPDGTTELSKGAIAIKASPDIFKQLSANPSQGYTGGPTSAPQGMAFYTGIGDGDTTIATANKICVGKELGNLAFLNGDYENTVLVTAFEQIAVIAPASSPNVVDVKINGKVYRSVRY